MADLQTLIDMGFPENRAKRALHATNYKGAQVAMDWIFSHADDPNIDDPFEAPQGHTLGDASASAEGETGDPGVAGSIVCGDCGKQFSATNPQALQMHAARTGHTNFAESTEVKKPLTAEEKAAKVAELQEKLKQKRAAKEVEEQQDFVQREKQRRATGKELSEAKFKFEQEEMKRIAEQKRREKDEERKRRNELKRKLEEDKAKRALERESAKREREREASGDVHHTAAEVAAAATPAAKEYTETRIQVRLPSGAINERFEVDDPLERVFQFVREKHGVSGPFKLSTTFPRKSYTSEADGHKTLKQVGMVPSVALAFSQ